MKGIDRQQKVSHGPFSIRALSGASKGCVIMISGTVSVLLHEVFGGMPAR